MAFQDEMAKARLGFKRAGEITQELIDTLPKGGKTATEHDIKVLTAFQKELWAYTAEQDAVTKDLFLRMIALEEKVHRLESERELADEGDDSR